MVEADTYIRDTFERKIKGGGSMKQNKEVTEYKEELRQMIENIEDTDTIKYLCTFIKTFLKEWE